MAFFSFLALLLISVGAFVGRIVAHRKIRDASNRVPEPPGTIEQPKVAVRFKSIDGTMKEAVVPVEEVGAVLRGNHPKQDKPTMRIPMDPYYITPVELLGGPFDGEFRDVPKTHDMILEGDALYRDSHEWRPSKNVRLCRIFKYVYMDRP